jgi:predicted O-methyltransferase YrrM
VTLVPRPSFRETVATLEGVEGWLTGEQARRLWDRASELGTGSQLVEIGSFRGRSTVVLASAAPDKATVVAIDPHAGNDRGPQEIAGFDAESERDHLEFCQNIERAGVADRVHHVRRFSQEALPDVEGEVDLLYIDGAHRFRPARDDIERWGARVPDGEAMLIHDAFNAVGVTLAQIRLLVFGNRFRYVGRSGSLAEYRREHLSLRGRIGNVARHLVEVPYVIRNQVVKVLVLAGLGRLTRWMGNPSGGWPY